MSEGETSLIDSPVRLRIFYYHFRKVKDAEGPCGEMGGFTRLLAGRGDDLMDSMPTVVIAEAKREQTRGFMVINR